MKSNLLVEKINIIQNEYKKLLSKVVPNLCSHYACEILDEINLFWKRNIASVQLYLKTNFWGEESYVFTAITYLDYEDNEHLPFLLIGDKHVLDDPLSRYAEICNKLSEDKDAKELYNLIIKTAEDNLKILENCHNRIYILPLRLFNQMESSKDFFELGEKFFISLFDGIESLSDFFKKCESINDIIKYARSDIDQLVIFTESDNKSLNFEERYRLALSESEYMIDTNKSDSYNFFILVFGHIQQAIDIILSGLEYSYIPFIRYPVALHYISLISEIMLDNEQIIVMRYKMSIAFVVYQLFDKDKVKFDDFSEFIKNVDYYKFSNCLFEDLEKQGINENTFLNFQITQLVEKHLNEFYGLFINKE